MKALLILAVVLGSCAEVRAEQYYVDGKPVKKVEALISLVRTPGVSVTRCVDQVLSDKGTLKNKGK